MSYAGYGADDSINMDCCKYNQDVRMKTAAFHNRTYFGQGENCNRCSTGGKVYFKQDKEIVESESDLRGLTRPLSKCDAYKFRYGEMKDAPVVVPPSMCPIIYSNLQRPTTNGLTDITTNVCREQYRETINRKFIDINGNPIYK